MQWEICEKILYNSKRRQKLRNAKSNIERWKMIRKYIIGECALQKIKLSDEEISDLTAEILEIALEYEFLDMEV